MAKKILVTNKQFQSLMSEIKNKNVKLLQPKNFIGDIFYFKGDVTKNPLMEGILHTYKPEQVIKFLEKRYGDAAFVNIVEGENGEKVFIIRTGDIDENQKIIDRDMFLCGYFPSIVDKHDNMRDITYEPRHQNKVNDIV